MPNTYSNYGSSIGDILGRATGARTSSPQGATAGVNAGSNHMLRSAQTNKAMADTDKILYALEQAKQGDAVTGKQLAGSMGVPDYMNQALGLGETSTPSLNPAQPNTPIPQAIQDKFTNASTLKDLSTMAGGAGSSGTVATMMDALLKGQDLSTMSNMQGGAQKPVDVATMKAAMEGKFPGRTGAGGGSTASKVQEMNSLTAKYKGMGMDEKGAHDAALLSVYGDPENEAWTKAFTRAYQSTFSVSSAIKAADASVARRGSKQDGPPGNVVKVYK